MMENRTSERDRFEIERRSVLRATSAAGTGLVGVAGLATPVTAATITVSGGGNALQDAIDAADGGDTVVVTDSATYTAVTVDERLTVTSENGADPTVDGGGDTVAVLVDADGVTFEGFTVTNPDGLLGIKVEGGHTGVAVRHNVVDGVGPTGRLGVTGILAAEPQANLEVLHNVVGNLSQVGTNPLNGIFLDDVGGGGVSNARVGDNVVTDLDSEYGTMAILLNAATSNVDVVGNDVSGIAGDVWAQAVNVSSPATSDVRVERTDCSGIVGGTFDGEAVKVDGDASGVTFRTNNLVAPVGLNNADDDAASAACNWWGHATGPDHEDNRRGRGSAVRGPVDYRPWSVRAVGNGRNVEKSCVGGKNA